MIDKELMELRDLELDIEGELAAILQEEIKKEMAENGSFTWEEYCENEAADLLKDKDVKNTIEKIKVSE